MEDSIGTYAQRKLQYLVLYLSVCLSVCQSVCPFVRLSVCLGRGGVYLSGRSTSYGEVPSHAHCQTEA